MTTPFKNIDVSADEHEVKSPQFYVQRNGSRTAGPFMTREAARQHADHMNRVSILLRRFNDTWDVTLETREITQEEIDKLKRAALRQEKLRKEIEKSRKQLTAAKGRGKKTKRKDPGRW